MSDQTNFRGFLNSLRVLELTDELGEYAGKLLGGLGAEVIKVEPPEGEVTRTYGPFASDAVGPDRSLHFWHYNQGKKSIVLDLEAQSDQARLCTLAGTADLILDSRPRGFLGEHGIDIKAIRRVNPGLLHLRITAFGDTGPWRDHQASDLVHLALGGVASNCGYDPRPDGTYDLPPVAPQMWQAYQITGEMAVIAVLGALHARSQSGLGESIAISVHEAVSGQTETDLPDWIYNRLPHLRATARHSMPNITGSTLSMTKDGRWLLPYRTYLAGKAASQIGRRNDEFDRTVRVLEKYGMAEDLTDDRFETDEARNDPAVRQHFADVVDRLVERTAFRDEIWREFQDEGLTWAPLRLPEENLDDVHWTVRQTYREIFQPQIQRSVRQTVARWVCEEVPWSNVERAPLLGEHNDLLPIPAEQITVAARVPETDSSVSAAPAPAPAPAFALADVRYVDVTWILASAGAGRFLAAQGAEVIKVEHISRIDRLRFWGAGRVPAGGRPEREAADSPLVVPASDDPNRSGFFMEVNSGKRSISLDLKSEEGKSLFGKLVAKSNAVGEGFSPGTMDRLGLGYHRLQQFNPAIVYAQQSGMGQAGVYGRLRSYGPVAQGFSGLTEMSGLPLPYPPAGIGYSYLDWFGAYNMAIALLAGIYRQRHTGLGCWIDTSQVESGLYLTGTSVLDREVNDQEWRRYGNRSPYKPAAPSGIFPTAGTDQWIAITCFTEDHWSALTRVLGNPGTLDSVQFAGLEGRLAHQRALEDAICLATTTRDGRVLMAQLQAAGVPAGITQSAEDRIENDPQLRHNDWMEELTQSEIGTWPVRMMPFRYERTKLDVGGSLHRHGPNYGEDNEYVFGEILGLNSVQQARLSAQGII